MNNLFPTGPLLAAFLGASLVLAVTPGPGVSYIVTRSLTQGRRSGLVSVAGIALGNLGNAAGAAVGLAAWFAVSSLAFMILKYAGAAYLIYLGVRTLLGPGQNSPRAISGRPAALRGVFRDAFVVALLNPKTAVFFAAFLPQFLHHPTVLRSISLGGLFVMIAAATDTIYAFVTSEVAPTLEKGKRARVLGRALSASVYLGLGLYTCFTGLRHADR
jgi:threonine/homoserine/homoserine lactone efflux protein